MSRPGPSLQALLRRLSETPLEFLSAPRIGHLGDVNVAALVNDCLAQFGGSAGLLTLDGLTNIDLQSGPRLQLIMILTWLLRDPVLQGFDIPPNLVETTLGEIGTELAVPDAEIYIDDAERREELVRTVFARLNLRPDSESDIQAKDRLTAISANERRRLLQASRAAEKRAREVREALARKAAQEAADKWTRE